MLLLNPRRKREHHATDELEKLLYIDALAIASANRLHVHSNGSAETRSNFDCSADQKVWPGKLKYIGIVSTCFPVPWYDEPRVWKIVVEKAPPSLQRSESDDRAAERRKSLRSGKDKGVQPKDWKVVEEGGNICRLEEVYSAKKNLGNGIFWGMSKTRNGHSNWD